MIIINRNTFENNINDESRDISISLTILHDVTQMKKKKKKQSRFTQLTNRNKKETFFFFPL